MKIGILYICTGKYNIFWKDFYLTCEKNFITEAEKHYFVFTDSTEIEYENDNKNITRIYQKNLGWPNNTLKRYGIFHNYSEQMEKMDYLFFFNANLLFLEKINAQEFLPHGQQKLVGCLHPGYYNKALSKFNYENNTLSKAFVHQGNGNFYFAGGINGGTTSEFLKVIEILKENIDEDERNKVTAKWHDESHWNWYLNGHLDTIKILSPAYLYPETSNIPFEKKIMIRDKRLLGGHLKLRGKLEWKLVLSQIKTYLIIHLKNLFTSNLLCYNGAMFSSKVAKISILISLALFFIKYKIPYIGVNIGDVFLFYSFMASGWLFIKNKYKKNLLTEHKNINIFVSTIAALLLLGTINSLADGLYTPWKFIIWEYIRMVSCLLLFYEITVYGLKDEKFLRNTIYASLISLIIIPLAYLSQNTWFRGLLGISLERFDGLFKDPNYFALFSILPTLLLLFLINKSGNVYIKIVQIITLSLSIGLLIWSGSRGGWIGLTIGLLMSITFIAAAYGFKVFLKTIIILIVCFTLSSILLPTKADLQIKERASLMIEKKETKNDSGEKITTSSIILNKGQGREDLWMQGIRNIAKEPLGYGPGYPQIISIVGPGTDHFNVHNIILETLLTGGVMLLISLLLGLIKILYPLFKNIFYFRKEYKPEVYVGLAAFCGILASALFLDSLNNKYLWVLAAFLLCSNMIKERSQ